MKKALLVWVSIAALITAGCAPPSDNVDSVGSVEVLGNSQYEIWDWYDLDDVRHDLTGGYVLMADLDSMTDGYEEVAGPAANDGKGWLPIGTEPGPFTGSLDGQGHQVSDLYVHRIENHVGLFGSVGEGGVVSGIGLVDLSVTGDIHVGGLAGRNRGDISDSYSTGNVTGYWHGGGLVGWNEGTVSNSYSTALVVGHGEAGGLLARNDGGTVSNSYATGSVTASRYNVGGLVGQNTGTVTNSYATGSVTSSEMRVGGLVGHNKFGVVSNSYATGSVVGWRDVGGLVGENEFGDVSDSFWDVEESGTDASDGGTGKTTAEMKDINTFLAAGWDIGFTLADPTDGYPFLAWQVGGSPIWYIYALPTVATEEANGVTTDSATLNMSFTVGNYSPVDVRFSWRETGSAEWQTTTRTEKAERGNHSETLTGLESDTDYEFKARLKYDNPAVEIEGAILPFTTASVIPIVTTEEATEVTTDLATLHLNYDFEDYGSGSVQFKYRRSADESWTYTDWQGRSGAGTCSETIAGLDSNTDYEFKARLKYDDPAVEIEGTVLSFITARVIPTVTSEEAIGVTTDSAALHLNYDFRDYGSGSVQFKYRSSADVSWTSTDWQGRSGEGTYSETIAGLDSNTDYEFKARLKYDDPAVEIEGAVLPFTTARVIPTVTTETAGNVTISSATPHMSFTVGDYSPVDVRFSWRKAGAAQWETTTWTERAEYGTHAEMLTGLDSGTTYEFKAELRYDETAIYGATLTFTTVPAYTLTISSTQGGSVTATVDDEDTSIGPGETKTITDIPAGTQVGLNASADAGFGFVEWQGEPVDGVTSSLMDMTMNDDYSIIALFELTATPVRHLPATVTAGGAFNVTVTFTSPADGFHAVAVTEAVPPGWSVTVDAAWTSPPADSTHVPAPGKAEYVWHGPYDQGTEFSATYRVQVPSDARLGSYSFGGSLLYRVEPHPAPSYEEDVLFDADIEVVEAMTVGVTRGADSLALGGVTVTLYRDGEAVASTVSDASGNYTLMVSQNGDEAVASKSGFRSESLQIEEPVPFHMSFVGDHGLIPNAPGTSYVLACISLWKFGEPPYQLTLPRVLDVISAWKFPIAEE